MKYPHQCDNEKCWCKEITDFNADEIHLDDIDGLIKSNHQMIDKLKTLNEKLKKLKAQSDV